MPGIALGNFVTSVTRDKFFPKVVDNVFEGNVLFSRLRGKARPWTGGARLILPTTVSGRTALGSFSGFDAFDNTQENVRQQFAISPSEYYATVTVSGIQKALNKGAEAIVDLMAAEFSDVARELSEAIGEDLYLDGKSVLTRAVKKLVLIRERLKLLIPYKHFLLSRIVP